MKVTLVENRKGRRRLRLAGVLLLLAGCVTSGVVLPASGLWLAFRDPKLLNLCVVLGLSQALFAFTFIISRGLALPLEMLPKAVGVLDDDV